MGGPYVTWPHLLFGEKFANLHYSFALQESRSVGFKSGLRHVDALSMVG